MVLLYNVGSRRSRKGFNYFGGGYHHSPNIDSQKKKIPLNYTHKKNVFFYDI